MKTLTTDFFRQFNPCYDPSNVLGDDWEGTILDLLKKEGIPNSDKIWASTRKGVLNEKTARLFAVTCVEQTPLNDGRKVADLLTDKRSINALKVARAYANGNATDEELSAAWAAAWAAAGKAQVDILINLITIHQ